MMPAQLNLLEGLYRLPPVGADRSGLNDCHSRICSETSLFSRSSVAASHRRRSSSSLASTKPARPDFGSGLPRPPYAIFHSPVFDSHALITIVPPDPGNLK